MKLLRLGTMALLVTWSALAATPGAHVKGYELKGLLAERLTPWNGADAELPPEEWIKQATEVIAAAVPEETAPELTYIRLTAIASLQGTDAQHRAFREYLEIEDREAKRFVIFVWKPDGARLLGPFHTIEGRLASAEEAKVVHGPSGPSVAAGKYTGFHVRIMSGADGDVRCDGRLAVEGSPQEAATFSVKITPGEEVQIKDQRGRSYRMLATEMPMPQKRS